ncbi:aldehyde dehydrogenase, cytosolic 1-like [Vanessa cardui]|uniref:aldehyde dehydrogenase, cytosolic 1-like n=1 Tax=Vanessa cardui TaxID=171605 RepID=UPI001F130814|nr:aldehyde dehydrogenase, cytosolic 1-like [Vanessa cardui]
MSPKIKYTKIFIDNQWVDAVSGKSFETFNPYNRNVIANVSEGDKDDIDLAVQAAKCAFRRKSAWRLLNPSQRGDLLNKFADLVQRDLEYLAQLETYNNGMVIKNSRRFVKLAIDYIKYNASLADKMHGNTMPTGASFSYTLKQPVGVCGIILPWNVPLLVFAGKVAGALAAGCTVIVKPAEQAPLTSLALAALLAEAGIPAGVVNIVPGFGDSAGAALTHHPDVAMISFAGSLEVGKLIQQAAGTNNLKRVALELGGKSPLVIMNDADLNIAVPFAALGVFTHQGQICIAASRLYVQSGIYDEFVKRAVEFAKTLTPGDPSDESTQYGPQIDETLMTHILKCIESGKLEGAKLLTGGKRIEGSGFCIEPTVFADVTDDMTIAKEEIFGPVQSILKFETLEEVVDRANASNYGLAAGIFTTSLDNAMQFSTHVEAGIVWVNTYLEFRPDVPFGGFKDSGIGRENGTDGVDVFLEVKTVTMVLSNDF